MCSNCYSLAYLLAHQNAEYFDHALEPEGRLDHVQSIEACRVCSLFVVVVELTFCCYCSSRRRKRGSYSNYCEYLLAEAEIVVESLAVVHVVDEVDAVALRLDTFFRRQQQ